MISSNNPEIDILKDTINELKKKNELYAAILDQINETVCAEDENEKIIIYNRKSEIVDKKKRSEMLGKNVPDVFPYTTEDANNNGITCDELKNNKKAYHNLRYSFHISEGIDVTCLLDIYPFFYNGSYAGTYMIGTTPKLLKETQRIAAQQLGELYTSTQKNQYHNSDYYHLDDIIGNSDKIKHCIEMAKRIASRDSNVMIFGETGTGKELFAQGIHFESAYCQGPFVSVNCAAIPESLLESELFGTIKGAFTDALDSVGLFEYAENGTIFLDEVNSMSLPLQAKLLRVIQDKKIRRIGSRKEIPINCRIISATNADLFSVNETLRSDLLFRLAVVKLQIPALRERREDILLLSNHFIEQFNRRFFTSINTIEMHLQDMLVHYSWPGNIRELENLIESAMNFVNEDELTLKLEHFPVDFRPDANPLHVENTKSVANVMTLQEFLIASEKNVILKTLEENGWNVTQAATGLGISRQNLQNKIRKHKLARP